MAQCSSCSTELAPGDRFCGTCGARAPEPEPMPQYAAAPLADQSIEAEADTPRKARFGLTILAGVLGVGLLVLGGFAWQWFAASDRKQEVASGDGLAPSPATPTPDPTRSATAQPQPMPGLANITDALGNITEQIEGVDQGQAADTSTGTPLLQTGLWEMKRYIDAITTPDLRDAGIPGDSLPIGNEEQELQCVNAQIAANPSAYAFPYERAGNCTVSSFSMEGGRYSSRMQCQYLGSRRKISMDGSYSDRSLTIIMKVVVPANEIAGDSHGTRPLLVRYRIQAARFGPC